MPMLIATTVLLPEPERALHLVVVDHETCGRRHVHRVRTTEPVVRRALCGRGRYLIVVAPEPALTYGVDDPDVEMWADVDGTVHGGAGEAA